MNMYNPIGPEVRRTNWRASGRSGCLGPLAGLIFLAVGIYLIRDTMLFLPGTITAQGTIVHCSYNDNSSDDSNACSPTIYFQTAAGQPVTIGSSVSDSSFHEGQSVQVRYHPNTPQDGRISSFMDTWFIPLLCVGVGLLVFFFTFLRFLRRTIMGY